MTFGHLSKWSLLSALFMTSVTICHGDSPVKDSARGDAVHDSAKVTNPENSPPTKRISTAKQKNTAKQTGTAKRWAEQGWPLLQKFCLECHNEDYQEAELDLSSFKTLKGMEGGAGSMQRVLEMVQFGAMPPEDADLPTDEERKQLVSAIDQTLYSVTCDLRPRPGRITARRLNRAEYNRSVSDLFSMQLHPADRFPSDEVGAGFDNNADVLSLSPLLLEKYLQAAEEVSKKVVYDLAKFPRVDLHAPSDQLLLRGEFGIGRFNGLFFNEDELMWTEFDVPFDGEYHCYVQAGAASPGKKTAIALYDKEGKLLALEKLDYYGGSGGSKSFRLNVHLKKGKNEMIVRLADKKDWDAKIGKTKRPDRVKRSKQDWKKAAERLKVPLKPDRRLGKDDYQHMLRKISLSGPIGIPDGILPPSQYKVIRKTAPRRGGRYYDVMPAAKKCMEPLMHRAFRRPVTDEEVTAYSQLVVDATERGESYYRGIQIAVSAVLMSPHFLFRVETPSEDTLDQRDDDGSVPLTDHQLATRMSYFLWSSLPDESLLKDADKGKLNAERSKYHAGRMISHQHSESLAQQFAAQWLGLRNLETHQADTDQFPGFDDGLKKSMIRETELLFSYLVKKNLPVTDLLTADFTFVDRRLAKHYGIQWPKQVDSRTDDGFVRVSLKEHPRRGVLSHASVLTLTSNPTRTSPVKRGKWILENVLGTPPPDPPPGVAELEETKTADANATLREQLELHRADPSCAACHRVMDQLGFGLENFDPVGKYRQQEGDRDIDASGELPGGRSFAGAQQLSDVLGETESKAFAKTVVERLLTFALGRELAPSDRCVIDEIVAKTEKKGYRFRDVITEVILSRPFQYYEWPLDDEADQSET